MNYALQSETDLNTIKHTKAQIKCRRLISFSLELI